MPPTAVKSLKTTNVHVWFLDRFILSLRSPTWTNCAARYAPCFLVPKLAARYSLCIMILMQPLCFGTIQLLPQIARKMSIRPIIELGRLKLRHLHHAILLIVADV